MNPILQRLGYSPDDRVVIVHMDDLGMCQATLPAFADLLKAGLVSSAAVMVPCPWFVAAAALCREHPGADVGVHLTITAEWDTYRWGPISTRDRAAGLMDAEGYFPRSSAEVQANGSTDAVVKELQTQLQRALDVGIDVTHVDTHMGTVIHPKFIDAYTEVARSSRVPCMLVRRDEAEALARGTEPRTAAWYGRISRELDKQGMVLFDDVVGMPLNEPADRITVARRLFDNLRPGLTLMILHPAVDTPELRAIAPDWRSRVADHQAFTSPELAEYVRNAGIKVIGYRALRDSLRTDV